MSGILEWKSQVILLPHKIRVFNNTHLFLETFLVLFPADAQKRIKVTGFEHHRGKTETFAT